MGYLYVMVQLHLFSIHLNLRVLAQDFALDLRDSMRDYYATRLPYCYLMLFMGKLGKSV